MAVRDVDVEVAVVVDVEQLGAEPEGQEAEANPAFTASSSNTPAPPLTKSAFSSSEKFVTKMSGYLLPSTSAQSTPMPARGLPLGS